MEETLPLSGTTTDCDHGLGPLATSRRDEARQYMAEQQRRLGELEAALAHQVGHLTQQLNQARQAALETETELAESRSELEAATKKLRLDERGLGQLRRESEANAEELAYLRQRLQQKLTELDLDREKLEELRAETKAQRIRIAHQLKAEREENRRDFQRKCAELDERRAALAEPEALSRQLDEAKRCLAEAAQQLPGPEQPATEQGNEELAQALADMTRRYELAMEDLREQKRLLVEKDKEPAAVPRRPAPTDNGAKLDWEAQKQRLLASLEADSDEDDDEDRRNERLKMREVIERTDAAIAAKDREIEELRQLLSTQSTSIGEVAVGAAAFADVLSADEIVKTERERLQQLQQEWEEKLRQAEVELSVQRARIARERAEIEERQRVLQEHQTDRTPGGADTSKPKPQRGRWLARLGLKEDEN